MTRQLTTPTVAVVGTKPDVGVTPPTAPPPAQRRRRLAAVAPLVAVVVATAVGVGLWVSRTGPGSGGGLAAVGRPAPPWTGTTLTGARLTSGSLRGSWVVLNVFASWCIPCREEAPALRAFAHGPAAARHARIVGILYSDTAASARRFVAANQVTWPIVATGGDAVAQRYDLRGLPESFIINPSGRLVAEIFGGVTVAKLEAAIPGR